MTKVIELPDEGEVTVTLDAMLRRASRTAEQMFDANGEITVFWLVDAPGEGIVTLASPILTQPTWDETVETKGQIEAQMRQYFRERRVRRYVVVTEVQSVDLVRPSSDLPDDEGVVFVNDVPGSKLQAMGRRGNDGKLYIRSTCEPEPGAWARAIARLSVAGVERVTGPEAEIFLDRVREGRGLITVWPRFSRAFSGLGG